MNAINNKRQKVLVFQQGERAVPKVRWLKQHSRELLDINLVSITSDLPRIVEDSSEYLPKNIKTDLVLDYLEHPDLSNDLVKLCIQNNTPIVSSGRKISLGKNHHTPIVCCALRKSIELGRYGEHFGRPEINITISDSRIKNIEILHGSPCGSTWKAADKTIGLSIERAVTHFGLNTQFFCTANSAGWDPISGKSLVHIAAEIHTNALIKAINNQKNNPTL